MVSEIRHHFPSQSAVIVLAHAAQKSTPPELFQRALLFTHLVRAFVHAEENAGDSQIDPDGPLGLKNLDASLRKWRNFNSRTPAPNDVAEVKAFMAGSKASFDGALRILDPESESARIATLGLSFLSVLKTMDMRDAELKNRANTYYPVYEAHPFVTLGMAREVLYDLHRESMGRSKKPLTTDTVFEPLSHIERFYAASTMSLPFHLLPHAAPSSKVDDAVVELSDLADKVQRFKEKLLCRPSFSPHLNGYESISLGILAKFLQPYKKGRDLAIESAARNRGKDSSQPLVFETRAEKFRRLKDGAGPDLPAVAPV